MWFIYTIYNSNIISYTSITYNCFFDYKCWLFTFYVFNWTDIYLINNKILNCKYTKLQVENKARKKRLNNLNTNHAFW